MSKARIVLRVLLGLVLIGMIWIGYQLWAKSKPDYFWRRADAAQSAGDLQAAKIHLQNLVRRFPESAEGYKKLAAVTLELAKQSNGPARYADNREALAQLEEAARLQPDDVELQKELLAARLAQTPPRMRDAARVATRVVKHEPDNQDARFALAWQAVMAKSPQAEKHLQRLGEAPGRTFQVLSLSYRHYRNRNNAEQQQEVLSRAVERAAQLEVDALLALSPLEQREMVGLLVAAVAEAQRPEIAAQRAAAAVDVFEKYASRIDANDAARWTTLALATTQVIASAAQKHPAVLADASGAKLLERAGKIQTAAVEAGSAPPAVYQQLAAQKFTQGDFRSALDMAKRGLEANAKISAQRRQELLPLQTLAAKAALGLRRFDEANQHAQAMLEIPGISKEWIGQAYLLAGSAASGQGRHEKALDLFRRAETQLGQVPQVRMALASAHMALKQWNEALPHLNALQAVLNVDDEEQQFLARQFQITQLALRWNQLRAHLALDQWREAQPHLQALQGTSLESRSQAVAAAYLWSKGQHAAAHRVLEAARRKFPADLMLLRVQIGFFGQEGKTEEVGRLVEQAAQAAPDDLNAQLLQVSWLVQQGRREEAVARIEELEQRFSDASSLLLLKAQTLIAMGKRDEALQVAEAMRKSPQTAPLADLVATAVEFQENDLEGAAEKLAALTQQAPDHGPLRLLEARVAAGQGDYEAAVDSLGRALDVTATRSQARLSLLQSLLRLAAEKGVPAAYQALLPLLSEHPEDPFLLMVQSDLLFKQGQFEQGMALLDRIEQIQPDQPDAPYVKASIWRQRGDVARALAEAKRALALAPDHVPSLTLGAQLSIAAGRPQQALEWTQAALRKNPELWPVYLLQADALARLKQTDKAIAVLETAIAKQPQFLAGHRALISLYTAEGDLERAMEACRRAQAALPDRLELSMDEVAILCRQDKLEEAAAAAERAAGDPPDVSKTLAFAQVFSGAGRIETARAWAEKAMALANDEQKPTVHLFLGEIALAEDAARPDPQLKQAARDHFAAVLEAHPNHFVAGNNLAWLLATEFNQPQEAAAIVDRVRGQASAAQLPLSFLDTLAVVYRKANRAADAEAVLKAALEINPQNSLLLYHRGLALADLERHAAARIDLEQALSLGLPNDKTAEARRALAALPSDSARDSQ